MRIAVTSIFVDDVHAEYERLCDLGVTFIQRPTDMGSVTTAVSDDTCGNLIQIATVPDNVTEPISPGPAHADPPST